MDGTKIVANVEALRLGSGQQGRWVVALSFAGSEEQASSFFARNYKQSVELNLGAIQASLPEAASTDGEPEGIFGDLMPPATETQTMIVNGEEAPVKRNRSRSRSNGTKAYLAHAFVVNEETPGLCKVCHYREDDDVHSEERAGERLVPHPFASHGRDNNCDVCGLGDQHELHNPDLIAAAFAEREAAEAATSTGNDLADKLIADAHEDAQGEREEPSTDEEAQERAEAEARLSAASASS